MIPLIVSILIVVGSAVLMVADKISFLVNMIILVFTLVAHTVWNFIKR